MTYFILVEHPPDRIGIAKAHAAKDWHGDLETAVAQATIVNLC